MARPLNWPLDKYPPPKHPLPLPLVHHINGVLIARTHANRPLHHVSTVSQHHVLAPK